jgi:hypothetical protein
MAASQTAPLAAPLAHRLQAGADATQVAGVSCAVWHEIDTALRPIIGALGVVALFNRSVHLTAASHPWLAGGALRDPAAAFDTSALEALLAQRSAAEALACGSALLHTLHGLLAVLIGASLTERLLRPVWGPPTRGPSAPDTLP